MLKILSKVLVGFTLLLICLTTFANYKPSRETVRFIFLFHDRLALQSHLSASLSSRISNNIKQNNCISKDAITSISSDNKKPRDIVSEISRHIDSNCPDILETVNNNNPTLDLNKYNLYILFSSEWGNNVESSFGHVRLAIMDDKDYMFNPTYTFSAYDFYSKNNTDSGIEKYFKAAFSTVEGRYTSDFFFDNYYETVVTESRNIHRFKVNISKEHIEELYSALSLSLNISSEYNFFKKNCSSESLKLINQYTGFPDAGGLLPADRIHNLLKSGVITYTDSFYDDKQVINDISIKELPLDKVVYDRTSALYFGNYGMTFILYKSPRPVDDYKQIFSNSEILKIQKKHKEKEYSIALIDKHFTAGINQGKPSLKLKLGYNIDNQLYAGVGYIVGYFGMDAMIGYSENFRESIYSSINLKYQSVSFSIGNQISSHDISSNIEFSFFATNNLSFNIHSNDDYSDVNIEYRF